MPFAVGETLSYDVSWSSFLTAGSATTSVREKKPSFNSTAYYIVAEGRAAPAIARLYPVYYKIDSLLDSSSLVSQRGSTYSEEGSRHRYREARLDRPVQDPLSALYVMRTLPLKPGARMTMTVVNNGVDYQVVARIDRKEMVTTALGESAAWKIAVTMTAPSSAPQHGAVWMADDGRHTPVKLEAELPVGSFHLVLREAR